MPGMAAKVVITERQQQMLQTLAFSRCCPQGLAHRAEIILLAFEGLTNEEIAKKLQCERHGVGIWRKRWQRAFHPLTVIECVEKPPALREAVAGASSRRNRSRKSWRWPANPRRNRDAP
jgi:putative transposase